MTNKTQLDSIIKTRWRISTRRAVAIVFALLGAGGLLAVGLTFPTNQPAITCVTISETALNENPAVSKNIPGDALSLTHAAANMRQVNSVINRQILQRQVTTRKQQLRALIRANPAAAREMLLEDGERQQLELTTDNCVEQEKVITGTFEVHISDTIGQPSVIYYFVNQGDITQAVYGLSEASAPIAGSTVSFTGYTLDGDFLIADPKVGKISDTVNVQSAPVLSTNGTYNKPLLVLMGDFANTNANWPTQEMGEIAATGLNNYYGENSYGNVKWDPIVVRPWLKTAVVMNNDSCEYGPIAQALVAAADPTVDFSQYEGGDLVVVAPLSNACHFGGIANVTPSSYTTNEGSISMTVVWIKTWFWNGQGLSQPEFNYVLNHEIGHTVNGPEHIGHANWANCPTGQTFNDDQCTTEDYYDPYDVLGGSYMVRESGEYKGYLDYGTGHFTAERKRWLGWFDPAQVVTIDIDGAGQTIDLTPIERDDAGVKMIRIQRADDANSYWTVEYRQPLMADGLTPTMDNIFSASYPSLFTGALIHANEVQTGTLTGNTSLLDATPSPLNDASDVTVGVGQSLTDPLTGATLTVISRTTDVLRVSITSPVVDYWPPSPPLILNDGSADDLDTVPVGTSLSANWSPVVDHFSGLDRYEYQVSSSVRGEIVAWKSNGNATAVTISPVTMTPGETFFIAVRAVDRYGNIGESIKSDGITVARDNPPLAPERTIAARPLPPSCLNVDQADSSFDHVVGISTLIRIDSWCVSADADSNTTYEYAIGTTPSGNEIVGYTNVGSSLSAVHQQLQLSEGLYYVRVRAVDKDGVAGPDISDFLWVDITPPPAVNVVRDGVAMDIDTTASVSELYENWDPVSHPTKIGYYFKIGTTPGGDELIGPTWSWEYANLYASFMKLTDHTRYYISVITKDAGGNLGTWRSSDGILVDASSDSTSPSVSLTAPENGATVSGKITLAANGSDPEALLGMTFSVSNWTGWEPEVTAPPYAIQFDTRRLTNGTYPVAVVARDTIHSTTSASRSITINNSSRSEYWSPVLVLARSPNVDPVVSGTSVLTVTATDQSPPITFSIKLDDQVIYGPVSVGNQGVDSYTWDSSTVANGVHTLKVIGYDSFGKEGAWGPSTFFVNNPIPVDTTPPDQTTDLQAR